MNFWNFIFLKGLIISENFETLCDLLLRLRNTRLRPSISRCTSRAQLMHVKISFISVAFFRHGWLRQDDRPKPFQTASIYSTLARKWDPISVPCVSFQKLQNPFSKRPIFRQTSLCKFSKLQNPFSSPKLQTPVFKGYKTFSQVGQSPIFFSVVQTTHFLKDPFL